MFSARSPLSVSLFLVFSCSFPAIYEYRFLFSSDEVAMAELRRERERLGER